MNAQRQPGRAPRLAGWLLEAIGGVRGSYMLGDLNEEFLNHRLPASGKLRASVWYWGQVIRSIPTAISGNFAPARYGGRRMSPVGEWFRETIMAGRALRRSPRFSLTVIAMLGLGVGAGMSVYSLIDIMLFRAPPHVTDAERVRRLVLHENREPYGEFTSASLAWIDYEAMRTAARELDGVAAYFNRERSLGRGENARRIAVTLATSSFFPVLGVRPQLGRFYVESEDTDTEAEVPCVISDRMWETEFHRGRAALGTEMIVGGVHCSVVGVAPAGFTGVELQPTDVWLPMRAGGSDFFGLQPSLWTTDNAHWVRIVGRLKTGAAEERASEDALMAYRTFDDRQRDPDMTAVPEWRSIMPGKNGRTSVMNTSTMLLMGGTVLLLLITVNLANLFVVRDLGRKRETAVRLALGGSRTRLFATRLLETILLGVAAGTVAILVTGWLGPIVRSLVVSNVDITAGAVTVRVAAFTVALAVGMGVLISALSAWRIAGSDPATLLQASGSARSGAGRRGGLVRMTLVGVQAALSVALLVASIAFVTSFRRASTLNLGFDRENLVAATVPLEDVGYNATQQRDFYETLWERARIAPGVSGASLGYMTPWWNNATMDIAVPGRDTLPGQPDYGLPLFDIATPDYLATMGLEMRAGRWIETSDVAGSAPVVVINEALADLYWPAGDALSHCMIIGETPECRQVVGVVANHSFTGDIGEQAYAAYFVPYEQSDGFDITPRLFVRTAGVGETAAALVRQLVQSQADDLPAAWIVAIDDIFGRMLAPWKLGSYAFTGLGVLAIIVGTFGLLSVLSYVVTDRRREFAIRAAIGARAGQIALPVVWQGVTTVAVGVAAGFGIVLVSAKWLQPLLFQTSLTDPLLLGAAALLSLAIAVIATLPAAREAAYRDPMEALRQE